MLKDKIVTFRNELKRKVNILRSFGREMQPNSALMNITNLNEPILVASDDNVNYEKQLKEKDELIEYLLQQVHDRDEVIAQKVATNLLFLLFENIFFFLCPE